jgi:hypothetical protein
MHNCWPIKEMREGIVVAGMEREERIKEQCAV